MIIIDASVAIKLIKTEERDAEKAFSLYSAHMESKETLCIASFTFLEIANTLATKTAIPDNVIQENLEFFFDAKFEVLAENQKDIMTATVLAKKYKTSAYDMLYAVLAKKNNTFLITADEKFASKVNFPFVKLLSSFN